MFKNSDTQGRNGESESHSVNLIGAGTKIKGNIESEGDIRIDGTLLGTIRSKGKVVVGSTGVVEGEIFCENADISGTVKIKITVSNVLLLKPTAKLVGDIITSKLAIESGATFSGSCSMGAVVKDISGSSSANDSADMRQKAAEKTA
ncbi:MAG: polymer-forming cytoskeletal protein [Flavobacteriales bacterium]|nr:polymer-forming cytoskeletal protein [Flavobacteriales bacterium]